MPEGTGDTGPRRGESILELGAVYVPRDQYDVAILGGGLAGLTLALQLKQQRPQTSIVVLEKREGPAPLAAFKVGESTVPAGAHYYAKVVGLEDHLVKEQNVKCGLRFFPPAYGNQDITKRVELGPTSYPRFETYQVDRGLLENRIASRVRAAGVDLVQGARVREIEFGSDLHKITFEQMDEPVETTARWIVDAAGRASLLKRKLGLGTDSGHHINSAWFRLAGGLNLEQWGASDSAWMGRMEETGIRQFSTNHLMGTGYWVWLIPLATGPISIGVCADPRFHPFEEIESFPAMLEWLKKNEPQLAAAVEPRVEDVEDFLRVREFSYDVEQMCSTDRWTLVGEAAAFADPFFSPGSDFIGFSNTLTTDLVTRELDGEDVSERVAYFNELYSKTFDMVMSRYRDFYEVFGNSRVVTGSLSYDFMANHYGHVFLLIKQKVTDLDFMRSIDADLNRLYAINVRVHQMCKEWIRLDTPPRPGAMPPAVRPMIEALIGLAKPLPNDGALRAELKLQLANSEAFAVALFGKALEDLPGAPPVDGKVNPLAISLNPQNWEADGLFDGSGLTIEEARAAIPGFDALWDDAVTPPPFVPSFGPPARAGGTPDGVGGPPPGVGGPPPGVGGPPPGVGGPPPGVGGPPPGVGGPPPGVGGPPAGVPGH